LPAQLAIAQVRQSQRVVRTDNCRSDKRASRLCPRRVEHGACLQRRHLLLQRAQRPRARRPPPSRPCPPPRGVL